MDPALLTLPGPPNLLDMASELRVDRIVPVDGVPTGGGGGVVQVVQASTDTQVSLTATTYTDLGLSATITPRFSTSKILMMVSLQAFGSHTADFYVGIRYVRDSTTIFTPVANSTGSYEFGTNTDSGTRSWYSRINPPQILDSPNTTSAVTYKPQARMYSGGTMNFHYNTSTVDKGSSYITLMEISA